MTPGEMANSIGDLFAKGRQTIFEEGMETDFSRTLTALVLEYENEAIDGLIAHTRAGSFPDNLVIAEAVKCLGRIEQPSTQARRLQYIADNLDSPSPYIRDGASLGLLFMEDPKAIPYLRSAAEREKIKSLQEDLLQIADELEQIGVTS